MRQEEISEISSAFLEAWVEFFGAPMYYIPLAKDINVPDDVYGESRFKNYDESNAIKFHGTIKERESLDITAPTGKRVDKFFEITAVTEELVRGGVTHIDTNAIIKYIDRFGKEYILSIYDDFQKVQLVDNKIFTKLKVMYNE